MKQGDIVPIHFPFSDLSERKLRPAVVLSNASYNKYKNVILAGVYGKKTHESIRLTNDELREKRLLKESYISLQNIFSAEKSLIGKPIDALQNHVLVSVLMAVRKCF